jgi:hypothetical protein
VVELTCDERNINNAQAGKDGKAHPCQLLYRKRTLKKRKQKKDTGRAGYFLIIIVYINRDSSNNTSK